MQAKLIPNPWTLVTSGSQSRNKSLQMSLLPAHLSPLHFAFPPFNSSFIIYNTVYEQGISMLLEVNTYLEQGGRRFNGKVIRSLVVPQLESATTCTVFNLLSLRHQVICIVLEHFARTRCSVLTRLYAQTNAADPTDQAARTGSGTLGKSRQTQTNETRAGNSVRIVSRQDGIRLLPSLHAHSGYERTLQYEV